MTRFFLVLIMALVFVATPAIGIVEIGVSVEYTVDDTNTAENEQQIVVTLTYNENPDPTPTIDDFTLNHSATFSDGVDNDPKTYFITWTTWTSSDLPTFTLRGYDTVKIGIIPFVNIAIFGIGVSSSSKLIHNKTYLPGLGYAIIAANNTAIAPGVKPTLPMIDAPDDIIKVQWSDVSSVSKVPDLYGLLEGGGTLNLRVNEPGSTDRLGSKKDDDTYDDDHGRNQRQVVINEVMWAYDESFRGNASAIIAEQWIELYNRTTTPIAFSDMKFTTSKEFPGPDPETDMLSNIPSYEITWEIMGKGQHGSSETPRQEFKSMQRVNYNNGWEPEHWSIATYLFIRYYRGTPGRQNRSTSVPTRRTRPNQDNPSKNKIIINEIGNFTDDESDWIELRNVTGSAQSLEDWVLTKTIGFGNENEIFRFTDESIPARGVLLLVNTDPTETALSVGLNIQISDDDQEFGAGPHQYLVVDENKLEIPNNDTWLLILRSNKPWDVRNNSEIEDDAAERDVYQTGYLVEDVAGPGALHEDFVVLDLNSPSPSWEKKADGKPEGEIWNTKVFPLNGNIQSDGAFLQNERLNTAGKVWVRDGDKQGYLKDAWEKVGFTGIGYDRSVGNNDQHGGTPGYDNGVAKGKVSQLDGGRLIISELMLTNGGKGLPQWIEFYNTSKTRGIDLAADSSDPKTGWQLIIENHNSGSWKDNNRDLNVVIYLKDLFNFPIPPNQTVLVVASKGRFSERDHFPDARVASIYNTKRLEFGMANRKDIILNVEGGFHIKIVDGDGAISDEVGNLDGQEPNLRKGIGLDDPFSWTWSTELTDVGHRTSLIRLRDANGRPRIAVPNRNVEGDLTGAVLPMGMNTRPEGYAWVHAVDTEMKRTPDIWYGDGDDVGTPGFIKGTPLPVSLSFFRPTIENGDVVIRWTTESEIDNAGFNILRSQNRSDGFRQINSELILGAGTSGERNTYKWVDTSAKPGVVYYYQIEDVSFAGESQVLTTTRLKGFVSATNKLTTTWSELKSSQ